MVMEPAYIVAALLCGLVALVIRMPPLLGFLLAGFALKAFDYSSTPALETLANLGVTILLFSIGLKLNVKLLLEKPVWAAASLHMSAVTGLFFLLILGLTKLLALPLLMELDVTKIALLAFALSFSSTVFVVKALEERSETGSFYGRIAIGVLIMQDVFAVLFMAASTGELPSIWALGLFLLIPLAPLLQKTLTRMGHGEMQILFGIFLALVLGYGLFEAVGVKGDFGALIVGMLLAPHVAAGPLAKSLFNLKELFLICFFISLGLNAQPSWELLGLAVLLVLILPLKSVLYLAIFMLFRMRTRSSVLATLSLTNYSEFGLIVGAVAVSQGMLSNEWLTVLALAVATSFILSAPLNALSESIYQRLAKPLSRFEAKNLVLHDRPMELGDAQAVIFGMGQIGRGAYARLASHYQLKPLGIDNNEERVALLNESGFNVAEGDAADSDFWDKLLLCNDQVQLIVLAMPSHAGNLYAIEQLRGQAFNGRIAAAVKYDDEIEPLKEAGADAVLHIYEEAGTGLVEHVFEMMPDMRPTSA